MTEEEFERRSKEIDAKNKHKAQIDYLNSKKEYLPKFRLPSTSKIVLLAVFVLCIQIVIFCEKMIVATGDMNGIYTLISVPVTLVPIVISYYSKSAKENTAGGIVYETALAETENEKASG